MVELYRQIWIRTAKEQLVLILLSVVVAVLAAVPLDYQKRIVNGMTESAQWTELLRMGLEMFGVVLLSLGLKGVLAYRTGLLAEDVARQIRLNRFDAAVRSTDGKRGVGQTGTLANIVSSESETMGKFVGTAISEPLLQLGTLISVVGYITTTSPGLGLVLAGIIIPQILLVLFTQPKINALVRSRVRVMRGSVDTITSTSLPEVQSDVAKDFDKLYDMRRWTFVWKQATKFITGSLNGLGLFVVLVYGGWSVTTGATDVGTVVAAASGLARIQQPWRELIAFYRSLNAAYVQFDLLREVVKKWGA
ncbi:MAG: ABC transporter transmembrane domain-containing protein [Hyphomicrobiaceae bacterium]